MCFRSCYAMDWAWSWVSGASPENEYREDTEREEIKEEDGWAIVGDAPSRALDLQPNDSDEEQKEDEGLEQKSDGEHEKKEEVAIPETRATQGRLEPFRFGPYLVALMNKDTVLHFTQAGVQTLATYFGYPGPVIMLNTFRGFRAAIALVPVAKPRLGRSLRSPNEGL